MCVLVMLGVCVCVLVVLVVCVCVLCFLSSMPYEALLLFTVTLFHLQMSLNMVRPVIFMSSSILFVHVNDWPCVSVCVCVCVCVCVWPYSTQSSSQVKVKLSGNEFLFRSHTTDSFMFLINILFDTLRSNCSRMW